MGYLMKEAEALGITDVSNDLKEFLLHLAQVIEDTESKVDNQPEEQEQPG